MKRKVIKPEVVRGGAAVPLGDNFYYMTGNKHKDGGIDVGRNANTGLEVEDEEVMQLTNKEVKVYSSVPFLNGQSPAEKILKGESPTKVFNAQQKFKKVNKINDDGTKKQFGGKQMKRKTYAVGGKKRIKTTAVNTSPINTINDVNLINDNQGLITGMDIMTPTPIAQPVSNFSRIMGDVKVGVQKAAESVDNFFSERPGALNDTIGIASNTIGGLIANRANNKMLDKLQYTKPPVAKQATKLKTNININPQLDKMRESAAAYERDIDNNTASSRVALARKQRGRVANQSDTNELYGNKENMETQLINQDRFNQQRVAHSNVDDNNRWAEGKANFDNAVLDKRAENTVGLIDNLNSGVQDILTRGEKRSATRENMLAMSAGNPNVNPRILKDLGVTSITDKMISDWDKAQANKRKKSKG